MSISKVAQVYYEGELYWVCTEKERAVLDAAAAIPQWQIETVAACPDPLDCGAALAKAELARRGVSSG